MHKEEIYKYRRIVCYVTLYMCRLQREFTILFDQFGISISDSQLKARKNWLKSRTVNWKRGRIGSNLRQSIEIEKELAQISDSQLEARKNWLKSRTVNWKRGRIGSNLGQSIGSEEEFAQISDSQLEARKNWRISDKQSTVHTSFFPKE